MKGERYNSSMLYIINSIKGCCKNEPENNEIRWREKCDRGTKYHSMRQFEPLQCAICQF